MFNFNLGNTINISRSIRRSNKPSIFENFLVLESFFRSFFLFTDWLFRVAIILKWFHQEWFLWKLLLGLYHPFLNIYPEKNGGRVLLLVKFQTVCSSSYYILKWLHQNCFHGKLLLGLFRSSRLQPSTFEKLSRNYRRWSLSFGQITDWLFIVAIKLLHQDCLLGNLLKDFRVLKYHKM